MLLLSAGCESRHPSQADTKEVAHPRIEAGDTLDCNKLVHYVRPVYPKEARHKRIEGTVTLRAHITKAGELQEITVLKGNPIFVPEALRVAKQWRYAPCIINSEPVELVMDFVISFNLSQ
jgi:periplasmic protein TonB